MQEERSVHDNFVYGYSVDCERRRLVLHTAYKDREPHEFTDIVFRDVVAHHFEHVLPGNILFDVEEVDLTHLVRENAALFGQSWRYAWPPFEYDGDLELLIRLMQAASVRAYAIGSSYGLSGWVLAGSSERVARSAPIVVGGLLPVLVEQIPTPTDEVRALVGELDAELSGSYAAEQRHGLSLERIFRPGVLFFIARLDGEAVGCGGVAFAEGFAEVKRMYVRPGARGRGVARAILERLEAEARGRGITRLALETGDAQVAAMRLYERAGFVRCGAFGDYAAMEPRAIERCVFFEKGIG